MLSPLLLGLAATATLLALAVAGILAALYRKHSNGRPGSPKHAPIVCEPPNAGATTPVHPQTKQAVDDIDPDIIPNEYGESYGFPIVRDARQITVYVTERDRKRLRACGRGLVQSRVILSFWGPYARGTFVRHDWRGRCVHWAGTELIRRR